MSKMKIIAIGAHCDDNEIGMGASLKKFVDAGHDVTIIDLIIPGENQSGNFNPDSKRNRKNEALNAAKIIGCKKIILDLNPNDFTLKRNFVQTLEEQIKIINPNIVFVNWLGDSHQDHWVTAKIVIACARKNKFSLLMYEQMTSGGLTNSHFKAQYFIDVSNYIDQKIESINQYKSQKKIYGDWTDAITARAKFRGYQIGVKYAESFEIVKIIESNIL